MAEPKTTGFFFSSLKDCLIFLNWLHEKSGKQKRNDVVHKIYERLRQCYKTPEESKIRSSLSTFLASVDTFYKKLIPDKYSDKLFVGANSVPRDPEKSSPEQIVDAFLECLPKFLAAMYYLWYNVDAAFNKLGGGEWQDNHPGIDGRFYVWEWARSGDWGGATQRYLRATTHDAEFGNNKGVIPGGFLTGDLKEGWNYNSNKGYYYAKYMIRDIEAILYKNEHNYFRDVFVTSVIADKLGAETVNVANALALVGRFCEIVGKETADGGELKTKLDADLRGSGKCICWNDLKEHCSKLDSQLGKIFKLNAFSFTGYGREYKDLIPNEFAKDTANWLRNHLLGVKDKMKRIEKVGSRLSASQNKNLAEYLTKNFFPYGFTFYSSRYHNNNVPYDVMKTDWDGVIDMLSKDGDDGGLQKLKTILEGVTCPPKKPEIPPQTDMKSNTTRPVGTNTVGTKTGPTKPTSTTTSTTPKGGNTNGTANRGTKGKGQQNQKSSNNASQNQNTSPNGPKSTTSSAGTSPSQPTGSAGAPGQAGTTGEKGPKGSPGSNTTNQVQTGKNTVQQQPTPSPSQPSSPPPAPPPGPPAAPSSLGQPGGGGGRKNGGDAPGQQPVTSLSTASPQSPGGTSLGPPPPGTSAPGSVQVSSPGAGPTGAKGQGSQGGGPTVKQSVAGSQHVNTQSTSGTSHVASSSNVPGSSSGKGTGVQGSTSSTTQHGVQRTSQSSNTVTTTASTVAATTTSAGSGGSGGGGSNGKVKAQLDPEIERWNKQLEEYGKKITQKNDYARKSMENIWEKAQEKLEKIKEKNFRAELDKKRNTQTAVNRPQTPPTPRTHPTPQIPPTPRTHPTPRIPPTNQIHPIHPGPATSRPGTTTRVSNQRPYFVAGERRPGQDDYMTLTGDAVNDPFFEEVTKYREKVDEKNHAEAKRKALQWQVDKQVYSTSHEIDVQRSKDDQQNADELWQQSQNNIFLQGMQDGTFLHGDPIDDDLPERLQYQRELQLYEKEQDDKAYHDAQNRILQEIQDRDEKQNMDAVKQWEEEQKTAFKTYFESQNRDTATASVSGHPIKPELPHPRNGPQVLMYPEIALQVVADKAKQDFAKSGSVTRDIKQYHEQQKQRDDFANEQIQGQLDKKIKEASDAQQKSVKQAEDIAKKEYLHNRFHGGYIDIVPRDKRLDDNDHPPKSHLDLQISTRKLPPPLDLSEPVDPVDDPNVNDIDGVIPTETAHKTIDFTFDDPFSVHAPNVTGISRVPPNPNDFKSRKLNVPLFSDPTKCQNLWSVSISTSSTDTVQPPATPPPNSDHLPPPKTVREMLYWFVGLNTQGYIRMISEHVASFLKRFKNDAIDVTGDPTNLDASHVADKLTEACLYSATVIYKVRHNNDFEAFSTFDFKLEYSKLHYAADPACLLCQLRDYAYACHHQLQFLNAQCNRNVKHGGWKSHEYGSDLKTSSPLQAFLTDSWDSTFETHLFDPYNLCLKSRVRMGFGKEDLPKDPQLGSVISTILSPSCGGEGHDAIRVAN